MKKLTISILLLAVMILSLTAVSAAEDVSSNLDDSQTIDVDNAPAPGTSVGGQGVLKSSGDPEILTESGDKNFTTLQAEIDASEDGTLDLSSNYVRAEGESDIIISKPIWIDGGNNKIDANGLGGIFKINGGCTLVLQDISLVNGSATKGGAIYVENGAKLQISNSKLLNNTAIKGGAIYSEGSVKITGSTLNENSADDCGGAIYSEGDLSVKDTTFEDNIGLASSIMNYQGTLTLSNVNSAEDKPIYNNKGKINSKVFVTILDNNTVDSDSYDVVINATVADENGNEIIDNTLSFLINGDEIDAVYNETAGVYQGNYTLPTGGIYTVDAVSSTGSALEVKTGAIKCTKGTFTDLQSKINGATANELTLEYGFTYIPEIDGDTYFNGINIVDLTIYGNGYTIDANGANSTFVIDSGNVVLNNITFINSVNHAIVNNADLTITSSVFKDNFCPEEGTSGGAAILNRDTLLIDDCAFENNTATKFGGAIFSSGTLKVINSNFTSNNATYGSAIASRDFNITGGIFSENTAQSGTIYVYRGTSTITGATFSENDGGAIYMLRGSLEIDSSVFIGNTAQEKGEAIYVSNLASLNITGSEFSQNGGSKKYAIDNRGTLSLSGNDIDNLIYNLGGKIISKTYAIVMGNTTIVPESDDVYIYAIVTDDAGNIIKDGSFKFLINNEEINATFNETLLVYEANYTLSAYGVLYAVSMSSGNYGDLEVLTGAFYTVRGTFTDLQNKIDNAIADGTALVELPYNFTYNNAVDGGLKNGIYINGEVTIDGNGYYIDGADTARIFNIDAFATVNLNDAILKNGYSDGNGGAIYASGTLNIDNCTFNDNVAVGVGDAIYVAPSYQVVVIMDEDSYNAQLADPNSALNKYYAQYPDEDKDPSDSRGHSWAAVQAAGLKTDVSELPWIVVNLNEFNGMVDVYYDGEHKFGPWNLAGRDKEWAIISVTNPDDCGMKQFALWGNVDAYATGEVFDPNKIAVALDGDMITPLDAMSSVSIKDSVFSNSAGYAIANDGVLSLEGNTVSTILNNGNIASTIYAKVMDNDTYFTLEDTFPINATLTDDNGNLIRDPNFQFTVNGNPVGNVGYNPDTGLYYTSISIGLEAASYVISVNDANYDDLDVKTSIIRNGNVGTYTDLQTKINATIAAGETTFVLPYNFTYTEEVDAGKFNSGIILTAPLTIIGNGNYIDGAGLVRIFDVETDGVVLKDIEFRNGRAPAGGAIYARSDLEIDSCTFINNTADDGNAIYAVTLSDDVTNVEIKNSIFTDNGAYNKYAISNNNANIILTNNVISNVIYNNGTITGSIKILNQEIVNATFGESIILNATFTDDNGNVIFDPNLVFLVEDSGSIAYTDFNAENGLYTAIYVADTLGLKEVDVNLNYNDVHVFNGYLNISTANVTLSVNANNIVRKQNETITVYLYDLFGNPLNLTVTVYVYNSNNVLVDTHAESTVNGTYSYNLTGLPVDSYTVTAFFIADGYNHNTNITDFIVVEYVLPGSYMDLQRQIDAAIAAGETTFVLPYNFSYMEDCDEDFFPMGVVIDAPINIDGNYSIISGNNSYAIFSIEASNVNITSTIFMNGSSEYGGAINVDVDAANVTISNSVFVNNTATWGGAISWSGVNGTLDNCIFTYNDANKTGGAVRWEGDNGTIASSGILGTIFAYNTADFGGALYVGGNNFTVDATFTENSAVFDAGAILWYGADGVINDSAFYRNNASLSGGAIVWQGDNGLITASNFTENNATKVGGAIATKGKGLTVENCDFKNNTAVIYGGAICAVEDLFIIDSEFTNNTANVGNAVAVLDGKLYLLNNIINTEAADVVLAENGVIASYVNVVILDNTTVDTAEDNIVLNATIVDDMGNLINADGFNFTINGNETIPATYNNVTKLYEAVFDIPEGPSIYYINMTYVETEFLDTYIGIIRNIKGTYTDLQNKVDATGENGTLELTYSFVYTEAIDGDKFPNGVIVDKSMAIVANDGISVSGNDSYRIFYINASDVNITNIVFVNGLANEGGAIYIDSAADNVTILESIFINNTADYGGAIYWAGNDGVLNASRLIRNDAYEGGAIYWTGDNGLITGNNETLGFMGFTAFINNSAINGGSLYVTGANCTIELAGISSHAECGGAAYVEADNFTVSDSLIFDCEAELGGAILWGGKNGNVINSIFVNNTANEGGAILSAADNLTVSDSIFYNNSAEDGGALGLANSTVIINTEFYNNTASEWGGAIATIADLEVTNSTFKNNTADKIGNAILVLEGKLSLNNNTINKEAADVAIGPDGAIVSYVNVTVLGNTTIEVFDYNVTLNATITDDMGNLIYAEGFKFIIADEEVEATYNFETNVYEAEYTLPGISVYPVGMTYSETDNLDVYIAIIDGRKIGTYTDLQRKINMAIAANTTLVLPYNFTYKEEIDGDNFPNGVLIAGDLIIDGNGYTISSNNSDVNVLTIEEGSVVTIENVTITGVNGTSIEYGAVINHGDLTLNDCTIRDNTILKASYGTSGAAIFNDGTNLVINGSSIINNTAPYDGSLAALLISSAGTVYINDTLFSNNSANLGGAIHVVLNNEPVVIEGCIFDNNAAYEAQDILSDSEVVISDSQFLGDRDDDLASIVNMGSLYFYGNYVEGTVFNEPQGTLALDSNKVTGFIVNEGTITTLTNATFLDNSTLTAQLGDNVLVYGALTDDNGNGIWDYRFNITFNGVALDDIFVDMDNKIFFVNYTIESAGLNVVSTTYDATVINIGIFDVPKANLTEFVVVVGGQENRIPYGENATVYVSLLGIEGIGLNETITVVVNDVPYVVEVVNGEAQFNVSGLEPGQYSATGMLINNENYNDAYATGLFSILEPEATLIIEVDDITVGEDLYVDIYFTDADGKPISGIVNVDVGGWTEVMGVYGKTTFFISGFAAGNYTASVRFDGDEKYGRLYNNTTFEVKQIIDYEFDAYAEDTPFNKQPVIVQIILPEDATGDVTLTIGDETFNATVEDGIAFIEVSGLDIGQYSNVSIVYSGDKNYVSSTTYVDFAVTRANPYFDFYIDEYIIDYRENTTGFISINEDATGNISVYVWNKDTEDYEFMFNLTVVEALNGIPLDNFNVGKHYILAKYSGDEYFEDDSSEDWFTVEKIAPELGIEITGDLVVDGDVTITFTTPEDVDGLVYILIDGVDVEVTGENGTYTVTLNNFTAGPHTAVGYIINDTNYIDLSIITQFNVTKIDPTIEIDVVGEPVAEGSITINVTLPEDVTNYVLVDVNGMTFFGLPENGVYAIDIDDLDAITYEVVVAYTGDDKYNKGNATTSIVVAKASSAIEIDGPIEVYVGDEFVVYVYVTPETTTGNYTIFIDGIDVTSEYTETIISDGEGAFIVSDLAAGNHTIGVQYNGDYRHNASDIDEYTVEVNKINTTEIIQVICDEIEYGDVAEIIVILPEDATGSARARINNTFYFGEIEDGIAIIDIPGLDVGEYEFDVGYKGNDKYARYDGVVNVTVTVAYPDFEIWFENDTLNYRDDAILSVYINESATGNISIYEWNYETYEYEFMFNVTVEEALNGILLGNDYTVGTHRIKAVYSGDKNFDDDWDYDWFYVEKINPELSIEVIGDLVVDGDVTIIFTTPEDVDGIVGIIIDGVDVEVTGENGTYTVTLNNFTAGPHTVLGYLINDTNYNNLSDSESFDIDKVDPTVEIAVDPSELISGDNATVTVTLPEDATGYVIVDIGGTVFYGEAENGTFSAYLFNLEANTYDIVVTYTGDDKYNSATATTNITVEKNTVTINVENLTKYYKDPKKFTVNVTDAKGRVVANKTVEITINGVTYNRNTDENGTASMSINLNSGVYPVTVAVDDVVVSATVTVKSTIYASDLTKMFRNDTQYSATFVDENGTLLANANVSFNINGVIYNRITDENGTAVLDINLGPGEYIITAIKHDTGEKKSNSIKVISLIESSDLTKYYKNDSQFVVRIHSADGGYVGAGEEVKFNINGVIYTRTTNETGHAKLDINLPQGNYIVTTSYNDCRQANNIEVLPILIADDLVMKYKDGSQFKAQLLDGQGKPYAGQSVSFNINGVIYNKVTGSDGVANLAINLMAGEYIITSGYNGFNISNKITIRG